MALAPPSTSLLSGAPLACAPPSCRFCTVTLLMSSLSSTKQSSVSSPASSVTATLWTGIHGHRLCPPQTVRTPSLPPTGTAGGYTLIERCWHCVQHYVFSCKASRCGCPDSNDLWVDLINLLPPEAPACECERLALHMNFFDADAVRARCIPWLLDPFSFLQDCSRSRRDAVFSVVAAIAFLLGASVANDAVRADPRVFASELVRRSLSALALPPAPRVAGRCPLPFCPARGAEAEAPLGEAVIPDSVFSSLSFRTSYV
jgi:hypothetical protein